MRWNEAGAWLLWFALCGCGLGEPAAIALDDAERPRATSAPAAGADPSARSGSEARPAASSGSASRSRGATREELLARLRTPLSQSSRDLRWRPRAGGGSGLALAGRFQHAMVARPDADGRLRMSCVGSVEAAEHALYGSTP